MSTPEIISIDRRDLENICRHVYLCGTNSDPLADDFEAFREEILEDFLSDYLENGFMCYGSICGSVKHELEQEE